MKTTEQNMAIKDDKAAVSPLRAYNTRSTRPIWHYWNPLAAKPRLDSSGEALRVALCGATARDDMLDENAKHLRGCGKCDEKSRALTRSAS